MHEGEELAAALGSVAEGVALWTQAGLLTTGNHRLEEIFRLPPGTVRQGLGLRAFLNLAAAARRLDTEDAATAAETLLSIAARREPLEWVMETLDGTSLRASVRPSPGGGWISTFDDITERQRAEERAAHAARHDPLTGLPNRLHFRERIAGALARGGSAALLLVDLDRFKEVNDTLGHAAGDALLRSVAMRLSSCFRREDTVARLGGDEFGAALIRGEGAAEAEAIARRVTDALSRPFDLEAGMVTIGASVGIAVAPRDGADAEALLRAADLALYAAKADGRGTQRAYEPRMGDALQQRRQMEADLRRALPEGELELHYQPILSIRDGRVSAMEALMRWRHPVRGLIPPGEFIPVAEGSRLIIALGAWALLRACLDAARWPARVRVAVNLSPAQFVAHDLMGDVRRALRESGLAAGRLEVEITESMLVRDSERTCALLEELRGLGLRVAMDDFGTGYSSLGYLQRFPFDKVKIDRSFVTALGAGQRGAAAVVRAVTGIAAAMGMETVAEGVETREQLAALSAEGCDHVQGWLFGKAVPAAEVAAVIEGFEERARRRRVPA